MIVFVGDKPSKKNVDPDIAFVGTQSYKRLLLWIWEMNLSVNDIHVCNKDKMPIDANYKYIALGKNAAKKLDSLKLDFFRLPHPSGLNRQVNDTGYIRTRLRSCKEWINGVS